MNYNRYTQAQYDVRTNLGKKGKDMMGKGNKTDFARRGGVGPNTYNVLSEFEKIGQRAKKRGIRFRLGRNVIYYMYWRKFYFLGSS